MIHKFIMKGLYSVILLFSFLVGTLQPILPMIEYQLYEGDIIELLGHKGTEARQAGKTINISADNQPGTHRDSELSLLNDSYYPLGIDTSTMPHLHVYPNKWEVYIPAIPDVSSPSFYPTPPPPRYS